MVHPEVITYLDGNTGLPPDIKHQIIGYYHTYFPPKIYEGRNPDDWFERAGDQPVRFVMLQGNTVISHASVISRAIDVNGEQFRVAGLGGVFTKKTYRNKGHGSHVVRATMKSMDDGSYDLGVLFCLPSNQRLYEKLGWMVFHNPHTLVGKDRATAKPLAKEEICMIRYLSQKSKQLRSLIENTAIYFGEEW